MGANKLLDIEERTIAEQWGKFRSLLRPDCPEMQFAEMQRAFYSGVVGLVRLMRHVVADESLSPAAKQAIMDGWDAEIAAFAHTLETDPRYSDASFPR